MSRSPADAHRFYRNSPDCRTGAIATDAATAEAHYRRYISFVKAYVPSGSSLLELGSSTGTAAACFSRAGYRTTAADLCHPFFQLELSSPTLRFTAADSLRLPFRDEVFDAVASYQMLEHVSDPAAALDEMIRVVKPGGWIFVAGPNLLGLVPSVFALVYALPKTTPVRFWFRGSHQRISYPFGSTYPEVVAILVRNVFRVLRKLADSNVEFLMRTPDFRASMHADADSSYLLNPVDLVKYFRRGGLRVESRRGRGPLGFLGPFAGGTWVAARKAGGDLT